MNDINNKLTDAILADARQSGVSVGALAVNHKMQSGNVYADVRDHYVAAQEAGLAVVWVGAFFEAGAGVEGKKASWFRVYKCIFAGAAEFGIEVTGNTSQSKLQKLVKDARDGGSEESEVGSEATTPVINGSDAFQQAVANGYKAGLTHDEMLAILVHMVG